MHERFQEENPWSQYWRNADFGNGWAACGLPDNNPRRDERAFRCPACGLKGKRSRDDPRQCPGCGAPLENAAED